ncbi:MAG: winged helix-turn-helix domain-containing protein [Acidobacteriota bacterium]|nr:winged helix-turn-helix domain-containing protein [Acidobacteriota bacterium]
MNETAEQTFLFADFEVDAIKRRLARNGRTISLNSKAFDLLLVLVENRGQIVSKEQLLDKVWANQFVEENNLTVHISALRKIFGEKKGEHHFIVTVPGRGYKFVADVRLPVGEKAARDDEMPSVENSPGSRKILTVNASAEPKRNALSLASSNEFGGEPLIGRTREIAEIKNLLRRGGAKLVTLTGAGGTGKTRLARTVGEELTTDYADGVFFIELASVTDAEFVAPAIATALGVKDSSGVTLVESLKRFLRERRILLILDNFEQLISAAPLLKELLNDALWLKILVTSRVALRLNIEQESVVAPLAVPPPDSSFSAAELTAFASINLFGARARNAKPNFSLTEENSAAIVKICRKLDGLPLAIELAAVRVKLLSPQAIFERLENSLKLLTGGAKDLPARQRTMRGAIQWSYDLLDEDEKVLFRQLAVFAGGFTVEAAESVVLTTHFSVLSSDESELDIENELPPEGGTQNDAPNLDVLNNISSLIENNLLAHIEQPDGNARLRMLEVVREFAAECLEKSGEAELLHQNHARFFLSLAEEADPHLTGEKAVEWLEKLETENDNFRSALSWALKNDAETAVRTAAALRYLWIYHSHLTEGVGWLKAALAQSENSPVAVRFKLLYGLAILMRVQGDYAAAEKLYRRALDEGNAANERRQIALSSSGLGTVLQLQGEIAEARKYFTDGLAVSRELNDDYSIAYALLCLGIVVGLDGKPADARRLLEESLTILRRIGSKESVSNNLNNLGAVAFDEGDYEAAQNYFAEGLELSREVGNKINITDALNGFAALAEQRKELELAAKLAGAAENLSQSIGFNKEPAERRFCETYLAKVRAALDEKKFLTAFEAGRAMDLSEAAAITKWQSPPENAAAGQTSYGDQNIEIIIENHSFSRIFIEEETEETSEDLQVSPIIEINKNDNRLERSQPTAQTHYVESSPTFDRTRNYLFFLIGAILLAATIGGIYFWRQAGQ